MPELAYISYYTNNARYRDFANAGFRLYSVPIFFSSQTINERTRMTYLSPGIYDGEEPDYSEADRRVRDILAARPDAYIFPRVNVSLPVRWEKEHPDELLTSGYAEHRRSCFASETWLEESKRLLRDYIAHVESSDYCDSIIGYQISSGNTEEWFPFDFGIGCCDGKRTQELISRERIDRDSGEFYERMSRLFAETIIELCGVAKECTSSRLVTGSFYGYTMFVPDRTSCHHGMKYILESDKIDFLCSPVSYAELRRPGMDHANMMCIDSLKLHGKLYMAENDTRTHLSKPPNSLPAYNGPIWFGHSKEVTLEILKMHFSRALTHG
ncbi:MAG: hypothetical protein GX633_01065, partial [Clostridiales bacterium]|nr:hypothetical protein [Clostridiales bacterium]